MIWLMANAANASQDKSVRRRANQGRRVFLSVILMNGRGCGKAACIFYRRCRLLF